MAGYPDMYCCALRDRSRQGEFVVPEFERAHAALRRLTSAPVVIAGGCLRDRYFGARWKDIDVFVGPAFADIAPADIAAVLGAGWSAEELHDIEHLAKYADFFDTHLASIMQAKHTLRDLAPIQIMIWKQPPSIGQILGRFDFSYNMLAWDGCDVWLTEPFLEAARTKTIRYMLPAEDPRWDVCRSRAKRHAARYPDFAWEWPRRANAAHHKRRVVAFDDEEIEL